MNRPTRWLILTVLMCVVLAATAVLLTAASSPLAHLSGTKGALGPVALLEPALAKALLTAAPDERLNVIVEMREQAAATILGSGRENAAEARRRMVSAMQSIAERTQGDVRRFLGASKAAGDVTLVRSFWIFNGLAVSGARPDVIRGLAARSDVALVRLDHRRRWVSSEPAAAAHDLQPTTRSTSVEWGVEQIRADEVWRTLGISGTGVVVANLDTGVDWQHPALQTRYRGYSPKGFHQHEGNWYDATDEGALYPVDGNGHGSHTMGTLVGQGGIGVAPGARWIAVRAFDSDGSAMDSWIHAAFEWLLAPNGDPDLAPQIVNNSWGSSLGVLTLFESDLEALRAAGIFALFSAGNSGPESGTVGSPASMPGSFAVGASDQDDEVAVFSSRGPSPWGEIRPHVVAPGISIYSTLPGGAYGEKHGTSMATPHVAGTAALLFSARPDLSITQTAFVLTTTALALGESTPNNNTGYGRIDAYAAVALAANAGLISGTVYGGGEPLPNATVRATQLISGSEGVATSDRGGHYQVFLPSGRYDLVAGAFGYASVYAHAVPVDTGAVTARDFALTPLPTGRVQGMVKAAGGGTVEAVVSVLGTPITTVATGGSYNVDLPGGGYTLRARALGYRVVTASVTVTAGQSFDLDFELPESMRILLVDSGAWYYDSQVAYYEHALDELAYAYQNRRLKHLPDDTPTITELVSYDLVVWSSPGDSPGLAGAGEAIAGYLESGGSLLLSGQDVAFWDGWGGVGYRPYYVDYVHSAFLADNAPSRQVACLNDSAFNGLTSTIQGGDGADNQVWPDEIGVLHPDNASLVCSYAQGQGAVVQVGQCTSQRVLNLGFGFEGINDAARRAEFMARALDWFASPRPVVGVEMLRQTAPTQIAPPGATITHTVRLRNLGQAGTGDRFQIDVTGDEWQTSLSPASIDLAPCTTTLIHLRVMVPPDASWNAFDTLTLTARSSVAPALSQTLVLTSKAPAPVLLVDDDRWYHQEAAYEDALKANALPYDRYEVTGIFGDGSPSAEVLSWYPEVLWFTGYDWFDPFHPSELDRLAGYLEHGGRLFVSSQDMLDIIWPSTFVLDYFGVITYSPWFTTTAVQGVPGHVLGDGLGLVDLTYPFGNWSDVVMSVPDAEVAFRGQHGQPGALTRKGICGAPSQFCRWRTAFFAFPVEALPQAVRTTLVSRLVGWLSWLGESSLQSDRALARVTDTVAYTLTLRNDGADTVVGAIVSNTLPARTVLVDGPDGGASYDPQTRRIMWTGDLASGTAITFSYRLRLTNASALITVRNTADIILGEQSLAFQRHNYVRVVSPDLSGSRLAFSQERAAGSGEGTLQTPLAVGASTAVTVTLVLRNDGLADALDARAENPLPWPLRLVTDTLSSGGVGTVTELPWENRVWWEGQIAVGAPVTLTYRAIGPPVLDEGIWLYNAVRLEDGLGGAWERGAWLYVEPHRWFLPIAAKDGQN